MKRSRFSLVVAMLMLAGIPGLAQADLVTHTFIGYIEEGYRMGEFGTGSFSYDTTSLSASSGTLGPTEGLTVTFSFDGQDFTQANDFGYDAYPLLEFNDSDPVFLNYFLVNGLNGVKFNDTNLGALLFLSDLAPSSSAYDFETVLTTENAVPIPGALWLLGSGLVGLVGMRGRKCRRLVL